MLHRASHAGGVFASASLLMSCLQRVVAQDSNWYDASSWQLWIVVACGIAVILLVALLIICIRQARTIANIRAIPAQLESVESAEPRVHRFVQPEVTARTERLDAKQNNWLDEDNDVETSQELREAEHPLAPISVPTVRDSKFSENQEDFEVSVAIPPPPPLEDNPDVLRAITVDLHPPEIVDHKDHTSIFVKLLPILHDVGSAVASRWVTESETERWEIAFNDVTVNYLAHTGEFGDMYVGAVGAGEWHEHSFGASQVFVKTLHKHQSSSDNIAHAFIWELKALMALRHSNLVRLLGFTLTDCPRWRLILEVRL
jgi:hypothetical protein